MATHDEAVAEPIDLHSSTSQDRYPYPYFVDYFKQWFMSNPAFGPTREDRYKLLFTGGLHIITTLDPHFQIAAQTAVRSVLAYPGDPSGAMTVIDPRTGYVRAMVGGKDADYWDANSTDGRVNLATGGSTGRQAGSSFKPFALVAALENGISPSTVFAAPSSIEIPLDNGAGVGRVERRAQQLREPHARAGDDLLREHRVRAADRRARRPDRRGRRQAHGHQVLPAGVAAQRTAPPLPLGRARRERGQHAGDVVGLRDAARREANT